LDDDYEIIPHRQIADLKKQLSDLRSKQDSSSSSELVGSMSSLSKSMDSMLKLFTEAADELKLDSKGEHELAHHLNPLNKKLDEIIDQNKTIAEGMVAIHDAVSEFVINSGNVQNSLQVAKPQAPSPQVGMPSQSVPSQEYPTPPKFPGQQYPGFQNGPSSVPDIPPVPGGGPVAMPSMSLDDFDGKIPNEPVKKKGIFGRLKK